jgi:hypothetical protein
MFPFEVNPVPLAVHTRETEVALVVLQVTVAFWPAIIVKGLRDTEIVGGGAGGDVVIVSTTCLLPPAPVAVQVQVDG